MSSGVSQRGHGAGHQEVEALAFVVGIPTSVSGEVDQWALRGERAMHHADARIINPGLLLDPVIERLEGCEDGAAVVPVREKRAPAAFDTSGCTLAISTRRGATAALVNTGSMRTVMRAARAGALWCVMPGPVCPEPRVPMSAREA